MQTWCRTRAYSAHLVHIWCILFLKKCADGRLCTLGPSVQSLHKSGMHTLHTLYLVCKFCIFYIKPFQPEANLAKKTAIQRDAITMHTGFVQVVRQLYRRLHLHVGLEDAAAERGPWFLTAVSVTLVEMVRGRPTVLRLLAQCTMECGFKFSVHQKRRRVPSASCTPNGNSFCRVASAMRLMLSSGPLVSKYVVELSRHHRHHDGHGGHGVEPSQA